MNEPGKRVSWVELYLDLVFVLAIGQLARLVVDEPEARSVWIALGLFVTLWWTWVGFAVVYNRHGADEPSQRLLFLLGSVPIGVAAVAIEPASQGMSTAFVLSLAAARVVLAAAHLRNAEDTDVLRHRVARACLAAAALFAVSAAVPAPYRYALWAIAVVTESRVMLTEDREAANRARREHDFRAMAPEDPAEALDAHHFAERFGLFLIIMLGEVVVEAGQASVNGHAATTSGWLALVAAMLLAAALWWLYFDSAAEINFRVLDLSGGSPTLARGIFAVGHMVPAFALLMIAAGTGLLLEHEPPHIAAWLACLGAGFYLGGTRALLMTRGLVPTWVRVVILLATFQLARLEPALGAHDYLWLLTAWVLVCAALTTRRGDLPDLEELMSGRRGERGEEPRPRGLHPRE